MLFDWNTYKDLADELRLREDEASKRSAISRLYYSVYWKARISLEKENPHFRVSADNSHAVVWRSFLDKGITKRTIFNNGQQLKKYRQWADYDSEIPELEETVEDSFILAERLIKTLNSLSGS